MNTSLWIFLLFRAILIRNVDGNKALRVERELFDLNGYKTVHKSDIGRIRYKEGTVNIFCYSRGLISGFKPLQQVLSAKILISFECQFPPTMPIAETLNALNINASVIEDWIYSSTLTEPIPKGNYTFGLNLTTLTLEAPNIKSRDHFINNPDFLLPLSRLKKLIVYGTTLPVIPDTVHLESLKMTRGRVKSWGNCRYLKELDIVNFAEEDFSADWPSDCSQLSSVSLLGLSERAANRAVSLISHGSEKLQSLNITKCELTRLPIDILKTAEDLNHLNLAFNDLNDDSLSELPMMKNLSVLDLSNNKLLGFVLYEVVKQFPALRVLILDNNSIMNLFCSVTSKLNTFSAHLPTLERLSLNGMHIDLDCFKEVHFYNVTYLGLSTAVKANHLKLQHFPTTDANNLIIDIKKRIVARIDFELTDYEAIAMGNYSSFWKRLDYKKTQLTILLDYIDCDCENYWFARTFRETPNFVSLPDLKCQKSDKLFTEEDLNVLDCNIGSFDACVMRTYPTLGHTFTENGKMYRNSEVECHNVKTPHLEYPMYDDAFRFIGFNVSDNSIGNLNDFNLPYSVQWLDLRGNAISRLTKVEITRIFIPNRRVWLSRNLFICDCASASMLDSLHEYKNQIMDYDAIICIESGRPLSTVTSYEACQIRLRIILGIIGLLLAVMIISAAVLWRYRFHVRIYLYSRGWCLPCLSQVDDDPERPYDCFLSFSHGDFEYVTQTLLPRLESEPDLYKVCVHYRDWVVGDWIPNQIMRSVSISKRTIILLSSNFVRSLWGSLEFRYAMANSTKGDRPRLLVLVLGDVLDEELDEELKRYLYYNTYLRCDDPWFWEKLRYAMPHRKGSPVDAPQPDGHDVIDRDTHNVINMEPLAAYSVVEFP